MLTDHTSRDACCITLSTAHAIVSCPDVLDGPTDKLLFSPLPQCCCPTCPTALVAKRWQAHSPVVFACSSFAFDQNIDGSQQSPATLSRALVWFIFSPWGSHFLHGMVTYCHRERYAVHQHLSLPLLHVLKHEQQQSPVYHQLLQPVCWFVSSIAGLAATQEQLTCRGTHSMWGQSAGMRRERTGGGGGKERGGLNRLLKEDKAAKQTCTV